MFLAGDSPGRDYSCRRAWVNMTIAIPVSGASNQAAPAESPLVAVVDDDASFLRSVRRLLRAAGYRVQTFGSAKELLTALESPSPQPQCLVLDVHMPGMTGLELGQEIEARGICLPLIYVTAYDTPQTRELARRIGAFDLILKPFDKETLVQAIQEALGAQPEDPGHSSRTVR